MLYCKSRGRLAQLGERCVRNAEVGGSIPPSSTKSSAGGSKPAGSSDRFAEFRFLPFNGFVPCYHHLRDAIARVNVIGLGAKIEQDDSNFTAISRVDGRRRIGHRDRIFQRQTAAGTDLRLITRRQFDSDPGCHQARHSGRQSRMFDRAQVEARVFLRSVGIFRNGRGFTEALNVYAQGLS